MEGNKIRRKIKLRNLKICKILKNLTIFDFLYIYFMMKSNMRKLFSLNFFLVLFQVLKGACLGADAQNKKPMCVHPRDKDY